MKLVPVPVDAIDRLEHVWRPFLEKIAERSRAPVEQLVDDVRTARVIVHLAYDPETRTTQALAGTTVEKFGNKTVAVLVWCTGSGRKHWFPLLSQIEAYHRELGCSAVIARCRPGWKRALEQNGYRMTHLVMEKDF
jgi:hypothetical protein